VEIREVSILGEVAQSLIAILDEELFAEYSPEDHHTVDFEPFHREGGIFVVAFDEETPVACGALRPLDEESIEVKRMFVVPSHRGRGVSRAVLAFLEDKARSLGFRRLLLETGDVQHAAIGLYSSAGFERVEPFGEYDGARSVCFGKTL